MGRVPLPAFDVVVVGSANLDLVATGARIPAPGETVLGSTYAEFPGGKGLNQAVAAARAGARTALVACVGFDAAADRLLEVAAQAAVDTTHVRRVGDLPTGRALITVDDGGENAIVVVPGANAAVAGDAAPPGAVVLAQLEIPLDAVVTAFTAARAAGARTILNPAPSTPLPAALLPATDIVVPNEHEVERLGGVDALLAAGVQTVIVTRGEHGVTVVTGGRGEREEWTAPPFEVDALDTTGAGDAFCGTLAAALAAGAALPDAVRRASAAGALATTVRGAVPSLPSRDDVDALLAAGP